MKRGESGRGFLILITTCLLALLPGCMTLHQWFTGWESSADFTAAPGAGSRAGSSSGNIVGDALQPLPPPPAAGMNTSDIYASLKAQLLAGAAVVLGKNPMKIRGRSFNMDCTGTVLAIFYYAGIDLTEDFHKYTGNGVSLLYKSLAEKHLTYDTQFPSPGDIIFWDNTWDANNDGQWNDPLTHVGMVVKVEADGNLEYIHYNYSKGNVYAHMNLKDPDTYNMIVGGKSVIINDAMRMKEAGKAHPARWLSSHLYKIFGQGYMWEVVN